ncbi:lymphocyte antigen 6 complex locus protein G6f [Rhineura floridana]|uniref:lymphocyte antigen 6 complex locus protein G6f n=1 Tax=Rhineura floridana TaxID=261503 RepID=UPI002AC88A4A|nr:lymphocyte antigen 6 complex locus protein G6f [Rhineura floridana]
MGSGPQSVTTALGALAAVVFSLRLGDAEIMYAEKGSSPELPCPHLSYSGDHWEVSWWYFDRQGSTTLLFRHLENSPITCLPAAWDHLRMLRNYSLQFSNVTDNDTGRYWCESNNYYDLVVVTGTKQMLESPQANIMCYVLSCSVSSKELDRDVVSWWEGEKPLQEEDKKGGYSIFKGHRASQLHICLKKGKKTKEKKVKCCFAKKMEITFSLTGTAKDCLSPPCPESRGNGCTTWIPLAVCVILQFLIIFALGVAQWRRRCRRQHQTHLKELSKDVSKLDSTQVYVNFRT